MRSLRWIALATACVAPLLMCTTPASAQPMERPDLRADDNWIYSVYEGGNFASVGNYDSVESYTVERVLPQQWGISPGYQMSLTSAAAGSRETKKSSYRISRDLNGYARQNAASPLQEARWLQWPLEPGQSWRFERPIAQGIQIWETEVKGWEEVEVPAGKFRTIRVVISLVRNPDTLYTTQVTMWYSPEVKSYVKKTEYAAYEASIPVRRDTRELTHYQLH